MGQENARKLTEIQENEEGTWEEDGIFNSINRGECQAHGLRGHMSSAQPGRGIRKITIDSSASPIITLLK